MNTKSLDTFAKEAQEAGLFYAYAVLKGCRMKALITEKYEKAALDILEAAEAKAQEDDVFGADTAYTAVLVTAYAEACATENIRTTEELREAHYGVKICYSNKQKCSGRTDGIRKILYRKAV